MRRSVSVMLAAAPGTSAVVRIKTICGTKGVEDVLYMVKAIEGGWEMRRANSLRGGIYHLCLNEAFGSKIACDCRGFEAYGKCKHAGALEALRRDKRLHLMEAKRR